MIDPVAAAIRASKGLDGDEITVEEFQALHANNDDAGELYYSLLSKVGNRQLLRDVPGILKHIIKTESWRRWRWLGQDYSAPSLAAYLERPPPNGIGVGLDMVEKLIKTDTEIVTLWRKAIAAPVGTNQHSEGHDIIMPLQQGTSRAYILDRLSRERPDLFDDVVAGKLSANAAAIEAGFRRKPTPIETLRRTWLKASEEERRAFLTEITEGSVA